MEHKNMMASLPSEQNQIAEVGVRIPQGCYDPNKVEPIHILEYYHQYLYASRFTKNKRVLDIASGEGYGAAFVSLNAESVMGIGGNDDVVTHASQKYAEFSNLRFEVGRSEELKILENSIDVAIAFDVLPTLSQEMRPKMMENIKRVLCQNGLFLASTAIRSADAVVGNGGSDGSALPSFSGVELFEFLKKHFQHVRFIGQKPVTISAMWSLHEWKDELFRFHVREDLFTLPRGIEMFTEPARIIALCSDEPISSEVANNSKSVYYDSVHAERAKKLIGEMNDLREQIVQVRTKNNQLSDERESFRNAVTVLTTENLTHLNNLDDIQKQYDEMVQRSIVLEQESAERAAALETLQRAHNEQTVWTEKLASDHDNLLVKMHELERHLEESTLHATASSEENIQLRERVQILHRKIEETTEEFAGAIKTIETLQPRLDDAEQRCQSIADSSSETVIANESLRAHVAELQAAVEDKTRQTLETMARLKEREDYIFSLEQQLQERTAATQEHSTGEDVLRTRVLELETRQENEATQLAAALQETQKLRGRLYELQKQYDERAAFARNSSQETEKLSARVASLQKAVEEKSAMIIMINQELAVQKEKFPAAQHEFDQRLQLAHQWEKENKKKVEHLNELQRKSDEQILTIRQMRIEFEKQAAAFDTFQKSQSDLQQRYNKSQIKVQELQQEIAIMEQKIKEIDNSGLLKTLSRIGLFSWKEK
jgi:SAM-dependent methyltransferase